MKIFLARHAETGDSYLGRYVGSTDVPISPKGEIDAISLAGRLKGHNIDACLISPMLRTRQTAEVVCSRLNIEYEQNALLKEIDFGSWECLTFSEISEAYPDEVKQWAFEKEYFQFPGGELTGSFYKRMQEVSQELCRLEADNILVVAHGGVVRALICIFLGLSFDNYLLFDVKPATYAVVNIFGEHGVLAGLNL